MLSLWFAFSGVVRIMEAFIDTDGKWTCVFEWYLFTSSQYAWYTYITAIANFMLLFVPYLIIRGKPLSKQSSKCVECICVISAVAIGLTVASTKQIYYHVHGIECTLSSSSLDLAKAGVIFLSPYLGMDLEVIVVSISLCIVFCFICQRIRNRQTAILLRNSVIHVAINASIMGLDSFRVGYDIHEWTMLARYGPNDFNVSAVIIIFDVIFMLGLCIAVITQAVLCIQTSTERNSCCNQCSCMLKEDRHYTAIDGKDTAATNPTSNRVSQPSYTNFAVPYTGGFTQNTASINNDRESEQRPLIEYDQLMHSWYD